MSRIRVTVEELKLSGFDLRERAALVAALRRELHAVLADSGARANWARSRQIPVLRLTGMAVEPGPSSAARLGSKVARGIGKELGR